MLARTSITPSHSVDPPSRSGAAIATADVPTVLPVDATAAGDALLDALRALGARAAELPCRIEDADLWFADSPAQLDRAKELCTTCPIARLCLQAALARQEPWGVWGGSIFDHGVVIARKRPRGRPRKDSHDVVAA